MSILNKLSGKVGDIAGKGSEILFGGGSIDTLKSTISKHAGLAKSNKFSVIFTPPSQSLLNLDMNNIVDSVISGGFDIKQLVKDPRDIAILCQRAQLPSWNISTYEYQANHQMNKFPYTYIHEDLTLSFLCTNDYYIKKMFDQWMGGIVNVNQHTVSYKKNYAVDIVVNQLNEKFIPVYGYTFQKAYPIIVTAMEFDAGSAEFVKMDITFAYDKFIPGGALESVGSGIENLIPDSARAALGKLKDQGLEKLREHFPPPKI